MKKSVWIWKRVRCSVVDWWTWEQEREEIMLQLYYKLKIKNKCPKVQVQTGKCPPQKWKAGLYFLLLVVSEEYNIFPTEPLSFLTANA